MKNLKGHVTMRVVVKNTTKTGNDFTKLKSGKKTHTRPDSPLTTWQHTWLVVGCLVFVL